VKILLNFTLHLELHTTFSIYDSVWDIYEFEETPRMSTYLLAFTVSDFKKIPISNALEFSGYASAKEFSKMEFALNVGRQAMVALEQWTKIPYVLNKMDFIAIDDFLYGAMV
jgi:aminopeptidase N